MARSQRYFVRHLPLDDGRRNEGQIYQIQVVDRYGRATAFAYLGAADNSAEVGGVQTPKAVIQTARQLSPGVGEFVDSEGNVLAPKDLLT